MQNSCKCHWGVQLVTVKPLVRRVLLQTMPNYEILKEEVKGLNHQNPASNEYSVKILLNMRLEIRNAVTIMVTWVLKLLRKGA